MKLPTLKGKKWWEIALIIEGAGAAITAAGLTFNPDMNWAAIPGGLTAWGLIFWWFPMVDPNGNLTPPILSAWTFRRQ